MFKSSLEICSQGYNVAQTDYYISNIEARLVFAETAYADAIKRIKALEEQNRELSTALDNQLKLIAENLGIETAAKETVDKETEIQQPDEEQVSAEESADAEAEDNAQEFSADVNANVDADEDITTLKTQIDELKFFFRNN